MAESGGLGAESGALGSESGGREKESGGLGVGVGMIFPDVLDDWL